MTINPVSSVNNYYRNLSFGENQEKPNVENKPTISTETKVLIGAGLTALATVCNFLHQIILINKKVKKFNIVALPWITVRYLPTILYY